MIKPTRSRKTAQTSQPVPVSEGSPNVQEESPVPTEQVHDQCALLTAFGSVPDMEAARTHWQYGEWEKLIALEQSDISSHSERGKLALLVAAAYASKGEMAKAKEFVKHARDWGCSKFLVAQALVSGAYNALGRLAISLDQKEAAQEHFRTSIELVETRAAASYLAHTRQLRETARMGLLPDALHLLEEGFQAAKADPAESRNMMSILETELNLLQHELSISLRRQQIFPKKDVQAEGAFNDREALESASVSQLGQDLWVLERTQYKRGGFFVEFGATDGVLLNNTWLLEKRFGWTGICAEPNPDFFEKLQQNRSCHISPDCVYSTSGQEVEFILADVYGGISDHVDADMHKDKREAYRSQGRTKRVRTISLHDLLLKYDAPKEIDYLSIDTEGSEFDILNAFPFEEWNIKLITVEHNYTEMRERISDLLKSKGYVRTEAEWDDWYERVE